jgi:hypothetical protein
LLQPTARNEAPQRSAVEIAVIALTVAVILVEVGIARFVDWYKDYYGVQSSSQTRECSKQKAG